MWPNNQFHLSRPMRCVMRREVPSPERRVRRSVLPLGLKQATPDMLFCVIFCFRDAQRRTTRAIRLRCIGLKILHRGDFSSVAAVRRDDRSKHNDFDITCLRTLVAEDEWSDARSTSSELPPCARRSVANRSMPAGGTRCGGPL